MGAKTSVPEGKRRERILDAALREFAEKGFARGSTNAIARTAGVAKGLLFHYFGDKQTLYTATVERAVAKLVALYEREKAEHAHEMMKSLLIGELQVTEFELARAHPLEYRLFGDAFYARDSPLPKEARKKYEALAQTELQQALLGGIDTDRLRPGVTPEQVGELVRFIVDGMMRRFERQLDDVNVSDAQIRQFYRELGSYVDILRDGAYAPLSDNSAADERC